MTDGRARVLWVTEEPPDRNLGGGSIRQAHLFTALASAFPTDLLVVGGVEDECVRAVAASVTELRKRLAPSTQHPLGRRLLELAIAIGSPYPSITYPAGPSRRALARELRRRHAHYDLVCIEHEALAPLLRPNRSGRWVITLHHLLSEMIRQELPYAPGRRQRWYRNWDLRKARRMERRALAYDRIVVCSASDAAVLAGIGELDGQRVSVVPNGVDLARFTPSEVPREPRVLFPGTLGYGPNVDAALWFCSEVWPRVRAAVPDATLTLAGRTPVPEISRLERLPGVSVHADVPSMVPYFENSRVVVVPLRVGTGTRLKALEAMAAGRPLVGTTVGLEGLGVVDGVNALLADDAAAFGAAVTATVRDDELARSLARSGRSHVEQRFGWDRIGSDYVASITQLLNRRPASNDPPVTARVAGT